MGLLKVKNGWPMWNMWEIGKVIKKLALEYSIMQMEVIIYINSIQKQMKFNKKIDRYEGGWENNMRNG